MIALYSPFGPGKPQPLVAIQTLSDAGGNSVALDSPAPIGSVLVREETGERRLNVRQPQRVILLPAQAVPLDVSAREEEFLQKKNVYLRISSPIVPNRLGAVLSSTEEFILLDCSFPFVRLSDHEYRILIGAFPPNPLEIGLTLPEQMDFSLTLTVEADAPLIGVEVVPEAARMETHLHLIKRIEIKT
jgi:hypothetical protein